MMTKKKIVLKRGNDYQWKEKDHSFLIDRMWPRGISKERLGKTQWRKEVAPSADLRKGLHEGTVSFTEFAGRYRAELEQNPAAVAFRSECQEIAAAEPVILLYASRDEQENNAVILKEWLQEN